jgi:cysteine desulfurase family protein (TIGR01976 family)
MPSSVVQLSDLARAQFPALESGFAYFENAGGSQAPRQVLDRMRELMVRGYVQTGAGYPAADVVDETVAKAKAFANVLTNGGDTGLTVVGPSTTDLLYRLANSLAHTVEEGDEVVVGLSNHESNIGPWVRLAESKGATVRWWGVDPEGNYDYSELESVVSQRTRIVSVAHTSNILGDILDVRRVTDLARSVGAVSVVDGVANAPHTAVDVQANGADFYVLSMYKVYGPHIALLFGRHSAWADVKGPNHFFIEDGDLPWKFELGCQPYEALSGLLGVGDYFSVLARRETPTHDRATIAEAGRAIAELEAPLTQTIADYLLAKPKVRVFGPRTSDQARRHPTFSFVHGSKRSDEIVRAVNGPDLGVRYGHMYAARLCRALGTDPDTGVVRVSAVHTNTLGEVERLKEALDKVL